MIDRKKFAHIRDEIIAEKGELTLFALFLPEETQWWDVLVSAPWVDVDKGASMQYLARKVTETLRPEEMHDLSRIALIEQNNPSLLELLNETIVDGGEVREMSNILFAGLEIRRAIIFEAKPALVTASR
jgi:hypothetical protein